MQLDVLRFSLDNGYQEEQSNVVALEGHLQVVDLLFDVEDGPVDQNLDALQFEARGIAFQEGVHGGEALLVDCLRHDPDVQFLVLYFEQRTPLGLADVVLVEVVDDLLEFVHDLDVGLFEPVELLGSNFLEHALADLVHKVVFVQFRLVDDVRLGLLYKVFLENDEFHQFSLESPHRLCVVFQEYGFVEMNYLIQQFLVLIHEFEKSFNQLVPVLLLD
mmetsp:Transcript_55056/g.120048  ORF Transcript_55056/g.120048 Transcript_55056/m.120048 type:complete len:218 (+) Transcript_55056:458-1111(+)